MAEAIPLRLQIAALLLNLRAQHGPDAVLDGIGAYLQLPRPREWTPVTPTPVDVMGLIEVCAHSRSEAQAEESILVPRRLLEFLGHGRYERPNGEVAMACRICLHRGPSYGFRHADRCELGRALDAHSPAPASTPGE